MTLLEVLTALVLLGMREHCVGWRLMNVAVIHAIIMLYVRIEWLDTHVHVCQVSMWNY